MTATPTEHRAKIAEARNVLGEVIARARFGGEPTILINRGKEAAVIVSYDFYEQALADRTTVDALRHAVGKMSKEELDSSKLLSDFAKRLWGPGD